MPITIDNKPVIAILRLKDAGILIHSFVENDVPFFRRTKELLGIPLFEGSRFQMPVYKAADEATSNPVIFQNIDMDVPASVRKHPELATVVERDHPTIQKWNGALNYAERKKSLRDNIEFLQYFPIRVFSDEIDKFKDQTDWVATAREGAIIPVTTNPTEKTDSSLPCVSLGVEFVKMTLQNKTTRDTTSIYVQSGEPILAGPISDVIILHTPTESETDSVLLLTGKTE